ncbi:hypothetical protein HY639_04065 [Candidatus Woesearchaeota archaeon]|nr:hypothetical protein [Candidatus Woesearchaeota archaeon]
MYIRIKRFHRASGVKVYYYVVEGVREADRTKQRVVKYLGSVESILEKIAFADHMMKQRKRYKVIFREGYP